VHREEIRIEIKDLPVGALWLPPMADVGGDFFEKNRLAKYILLVALSAFLATNASSS